MKMHNKYLCRSLRMILLKGKFLFQTTKYNKEFPLPWLFSTTKIQKDDRLKINHLNTS